MYGGNVVLTPNNFRVPSAPVNGKHAYLTWDGDAENSGSRNGFNERLTFNGSVLSDANNPTNNQFNSVSNINGVDTNSYGVDFDIYTINSLLSAGDTSATSVYSSGADQVHLSMEIISTTNTPVSDLSITKTATSAFKVGANATYNLAVSNQGPNNEPGNIIVTDTLPAGITLNSATGSGWSCGAAGQVVTCTRVGNLAHGASASPITINVNVGAAASPSISNTASVDGVNFDNISSNNSSTVTTTVSSSPAISLQKHLLTISDPINGTNNPKAIPGALTQYTITATNSGLTPADNNTIVISDAIPANTALYVNDISGANSGPVRFVDGIPPSGLNYNFSGLSSPSDNLSFSQNSGADNFQYIPVANADGVDTNVTHVRVSTSGQFLPTSGSGNPSFQTMFRVRVE